MKVKYQTQNTRAQLLTY